MNELKKKVAIDFGREIECLEKIEECINILRDEDKLEKSVRAEYDGFIAMSHRINGCSEDMFQNSLKAEKLLLKRRIFKLIDELTDIKFNQVKDILDHENLSCREVMTIKNRIQSRILSSMEDDRDKETIVIGNDITNRQLSFIKDDVDKGLYK